MIKLFITDVDATLTNGVYQMGEDGSLVKGFYSRDFHGMMMLNDTGVKICIISASRDKVIKQQCDRAAQYATVLTGAKNKVDVVAEQFVSGGIVSWDEVAYIGDDVFDADLLNKVGLASCPSDAHSDIEGLILGRDDGFVSAFPGGYGAVREFTDYVLEVNRARRKITHAVARIGGTT